MKRASNHTWLESQQKPLRRHSHLGRELSTLFLVTMAMGLFVLVAITLFAPDLWKWAI